MSLIAQLVWNSCPEIDGVQNVHGKVIKNVDTSVVGTYIDSWRKIPVRVSVAPFEIGWVIGFSIE